VIALQWLKNGSVLNVSFQLFLASLNVHTILENCLNFLNAVYFKISVAKQELHRAASFCWSSIIEHLSIIASLHIGYVSEQKKNDVAPQHCVQYSTLNVMRYLGEIETMFFYRLCYVI
jgi:hypothetical protein